MPTTGVTPKTLSRDLTAGLVVFLVALPLCLGVALASGAPLLAGIIAGIVGGVLVGILSGSHTSVSGPAAGLTAVVAAQIASLGSFEAFLFAAAIAGLIQIGLGIARAGSVAAFVPSSVINGLLAAIGVILILKQVPHLLGHDTDPPGDLAFWQPDKENTFSELIRSVGGFHRGAAVIGLASLALLIVWDRIKLLKRLPIPAALVVVVLGIFLNFVFMQLGGRWLVGPTHLVQVPVAESIAGFVGLMRMPDVTQWANPAIYLAAVTIAAVASLETLLNLEAVDKLDPQQRNSPPSRELLAQGFANVVSSTIGGLPLTSVIVRSSVNIAAGGQTKLAAIVHGVLLLFFVAFLPRWLNTIPLSCLAAILFVVGLKLASPALAKRMWDGGRYQFIPFAVTVAAIVLTDLLVGVLIGMGVSIAFILSSNVRRPIRRIVEKHLGGEVTHVELANQVSFLNRAALARVLDEVPRGGQILLDARGTDYIDPDVLGLIQDFSDVTASARGVRVSLLGFRKKYRLDDRTLYVDQSTRDLQDALTPDQVLAILKDGHDRFRSGQRLTRDLGRMIDASAGGQHPLAVVLSCIDSRAPVELIFDLGVGDVFSVRIAGNVTSPQVLGSVEYACNVAGAKLVLVMGHTRCGAVTAAVELAMTGGPAGNSPHLASIVREVQRSIHPVARPDLARLSPAEKAAFIDAVACRNVIQAVDTALRESESLDRLVRQGRIAIVGAMYDVATGEIEFLSDSATAQQLTCDAETPAGRC